MSMSHREGRFMLAVLFTILLSVVIGRAGITHPTLSRPAYAAPDVTAEALENGGWEMRDGEWTAPSTFPFPSSILPFPFAEPDEPSTLQPSTTTRDEGLAFGMGTYLGTGEFGQEQRAARLSAEAGADWAREEFPWAEIEPQREQYRWRWEDRDYDAAVDALLAEGIRIVGLLDYGPRCETDKNPPIGWGCDLTIDQWLPDWRRYVKTVVSRYKGKIDVWEIQNEENSRAFWRKVNPEATDPNPQDYARLLRAAAEEIKRVDPNAKIVLGGLAGYTSDLQDPAQNYFHYLAQLHKAGAWDAFDVVAVHPYREMEAAAPEQPIPRGNYDPDRRTFNPNVTQQWNLVQELSALDRMVSQLGGKPIWITELGWSTGALQARADQRGTTAQVVQADYLVRTYVQLLALPNVEQLFWFRLRDRDLLFGLIDNDYVPKESYGAYQKMTALLGGSRFLQRVRGAGYTGASAQDDVFEYRFQKGEQTIIVLWKAVGGDEPRAVTITDISAPTVRVIDPNESRTGPDAGREVQTVNGQIILQLTERPVYVVYGVPRASRRTSVQTTWPIAPYNVGVEGRGPIRLSVDGKPVLETESGNQETHQAQKRVWLRRGCHTVEVKYGQNDSPPRLGISLWPRTPDFDAGLPKCEEEPPDKPTNTPDAPVRAFFEAMDRLDVDAATETIAPVPWYRQTAGWTLGLYKGTLDALNWDNDFSRLRYQVLDNDGQSARVHVAGPVIIRNTEDGSTVHELEGFEVEVPVSNFLIRWYIYISPRHLLPKISE